MQKRLLQFLTLFIFSAFALTSCTEDGTIDPTPGVNAPSIRLVAGTGFISSSAFVQVGDTMMFKINASAGDADLSLLTIKEDGKNLGLSELIFPTGTPFGSNPAQILNAGDKLGFTYDIHIIAPPTASNYEYAFEIKDDANKTAQATVTVSVEATAPLLSLVDTPSDLQAGRGSLQTVKISAVKGTYDLSTIAVYENDVLMDPARVFIDNNGLQAFTTNPNATPSTDSFDATLVIEMAATGDAATYGIDVADTQGLLGSLNISVTLGLPIDTSYTGVLVYNRDGQQFGGLNLYTGESVAFNSPDAQIRDLGIDLNQPVASNWIQKIIPVNNAVLKVPGANQPEGFSFANVTSRDILIAAFDAGDAINQSEKVQIGDIFLVQKDDDYFILEVTNVVVTDNDNNDYYEFSIKKSEI